MTPETLAKDRKELQLRLAQVRQEVVEASGYGWTKWKDVIKIACSQVPLDSKLEISSDRPDVYLVYNETVGAGISRELIFSEKLGIWNLLYEVKNVLTPMKIVASKNLKGEISVQFREGEKIDSNFVY